MRHNQLERELNLLLLLVENRERSVESLCESVGISKRNFYYYLEFFREAGFDVVKQNGTYGISRNSPYLLKLFRTISITEDEAIAIRRLIDSTGTDSVQLKNIRAKLGNFFDLDILCDVEPRINVVENINTLYEAIKRRNKVIIHNYSSPHSGTLSSRIVEPFMFLSNNNEVRCYEITARMNKTFKVQRMERVEMLLDPWEHEDEHRRMHIDLFNFSGERLSPISLRLDRLAHDVLLEEYPRAEEALTPDGPRHWLFNTEVCSYVGVGRFVLGLFQSIDIIGDEGFRQHMALLASQMSEKWNVK